MIRRQAPLLAVLAFALSACAQSGQPGVLDRERAQSLEDAFISAPIGGPEVLSVAEERFPNATQQRILLGNRSAVPGSNYIQVQFFGPVGNTGTGRTALPNRMIHAADMSREMRTELPTVPMRRSPLFVQNRYGPFGYAVGRSGGGDTCVYAWQRIAGVDTTTLIPRNRGTIQLRLRLCDRVASEEALLTAMYNLSIRAAFSNLTWNPYGPPPGLDPRVGTIGETIMPEGERGFEAVIPVVQPAPEIAAAPARRRSAAVRAAPAAVAPPLPAPVGPLVPPPPPSIGAPAPIVPIAPQAQAAPSAVRPASPAVPSQASAVPAAAAVPGTAPQSSEIVVVPPPPATCTVQQRSGGLC